MPRDNYYNVYSIPTGNQLEGELKDVFYHHFTKKSGIVTKTEFRWATKEEDRKLGTDAFIYGLPCDFTCNFAGKDHMTALETNVPLPGIGTVRFGVRTGNRHVQFDTPVLVIGVDAGYLRKGFIRTVIDAFSDKVAEIIETGQDAYWNYCDQIS